MGLLMMRPIMKLMFGKVLKGLNDHATTGLMIGEKGVLQREV